MTYPRQTMKFGSSSSQASQSSTGDICRICHCESDPQNPLLTPCYCSGSLKYVHQACLQQWLTASETNSCELCKFPFIMHTKIKPFNEWRSLDISGIERRRLCCSVLFHCAAALCVIWSLCVLIERAADDVQRGLIDWPFWTKLAVVLVGLTGGVVFMYIQCKAYLHLCHRWKARNRILLIQNAPEKIHPIVQPSPAIQHRSRNQHHYEGSGSDSQRIFASTQTGGHNTMEIAANIVATPSNVCNYGNPPPGGFIGATVVNMEVVNEDTGAAALHRHHHHHHQHQQQQQQQQHHQHHQYHHHHPHSHLQHHQLHHLQSSDLGDIDSLVTPRSSSTVGVHDGSHLSSVHHQQHPQHQLSQVAVAANIECSQSQHNYERDWALDDVVSQISSFRPCPQGSGSMTPFHDSIHNVLEHSESSSRGGSVNDVCSGSRQDLSTSGISTDTGREHAMQLSSFSGSGEHKAPSISSGVSHAVANGLGSFVYKPHATAAGANKRYSNSSIFLENRDILNDDSAILNTELALGDFPKYNYRHSSELTATRTKTLPLSPPVTIMTSPHITNSREIDKYLGKDLRRYSDTKLLSSSSSYNVDVDAEAHTPMLFNAIDSGAYEQRPKKSTQLRQLVKQHTADEVLDMELPVSPLSPLAIYVGIQGQHPMSPTALRHSMQTVLVGDVGTADSDVQASNSRSTATAAGAAATGVPSATMATASTSSGQQIDKGRIFFKSLPNLSSSCESLLKKGI